MAKNDLTARVKRAMASRKSLVMSEVEQLTSQVCDELGISDEDEVSAAVRQALVDILDSDDRPEENEVRDVTVTLSGVMVIQATSQDDLDEQLEELRETMRNYGVKDEATVASYEDSDPCLSSSDEDEDEDEYFYE